MSLCLSCTVLPVETCILWPLGLSNWASVVEKEPVACFNRFWLIRSLHIACRSLWLRVWAILPFDKCLKKETNIFAVVRMYRAFLLSPDACIRWFDRNDGAGVLIHTYEPTDTIKPCFGHLALMYSKPRSASVFAKTDGALWELDRPVFRRILVKKSKREVGS